MMMEICLSIRRGHASFRAIVTFDKFTCAWLLLKFMATSTAGCHQHGPLKVPATCGATPWRHWELLAGNSQSTNCRPPNSTALW